MVSMAASNLKHFTTDSWNALANKTWDLVSNCKNLNEKVTLMTNMVNESLDHSI